MDRQQDPLIHVKQYATLHHVILGKQFYGPVAYTHHLQDVENVLRDFGETRMFMFEAAWCHDIIEDTDRKARDIEETFGEEVARLVVAVTSEAGENRRVRNALTYPKIRAAGPDAIILKLADRIANVSHAGPSLSMYRKEYADFRHALYDHSLRDVHPEDADVRTFQYVMLKEMWEMLDGLMAWEGIR